MRRRRRQVTKVDWCLTHESLRHQTFIEYCSHGYALWFYSETEEQVSICRFVVARLSVPENT